MDETTPRVLVIEDEPDVLDSVRAFLTRRGCLVFVSPSGHEGLTIARTLQPDIIVLDFRIEGLHGREVLAALHAEGHPAKVIVVTGELMDEQAVKGLLASGASAFFKKPVSLSELNSVIRELVKGKYPAFAYQLLARREYEHFLDERGVIHKLANELGIIRARSEQFVLDEEDGIHAGLSAEELAQRSRDTIRIVHAAVDRAAGLLDKLSNMRR